jgi:GH15 family glucan-1,4-alpha-glucosidase
VDRGLRLAEKRQFPLGRERRQKWLDTRDELYEEIQVCRSTICSVRGKMLTGGQTKGWNASKGFYAQSYDEPEVLDSAVLIMPLVFFCPASDPRFLSTLQQIRRPPERGGLSANSLVYRYDVAKSDDGVGGEEGFFSLCE